jgi:hypothetical protein
VHPNQQTIKYAFGVIATINLIIAAVAVLY